MYQHIVFWFSVTVILGTTYSEFRVPIVQTSLGYVTGRHTRSYGGRLVTAFEGIPYAKPPVGDLRFREPQPIEPWSNTLVANKTYVCMQYTAVVPSKSVLGSEDCLYLYIYVPRGTIIGTENMGVVVHIHGGGFVNGDPTSSGPGYIMDRDLVYVSMNHRVGILGFLSTEDEVVPGNNGLKDQVLAMKWIKDNIHFFGGNPDSITLIGASSGATCVHYHYLSPLSTGLFHRGLSQSGTVLNHWALTKNPSKNAKKLGKHFKCNVESSQKMVQCLKKVSAENLTLALGDFFVFANVFPSSPFGPVIENGTGAFLEDHPYKLLKEGKINHHPWITSNVKDEGIVPVGFFILFGNLQELDARWNELLPYTLGYHDSADEGDKTAISEKVKEFYLKNENITEENVEDVVRLFSDRLFLLDALKATLLHAKVSKSPVHYYYFDYLLDMQVPFKANLSVVAHGDDSRILYQDSDNPNVLSESDAQMKDIFIDFLYNYALGGIPNIKGEEWKRVSTLIPEIRYMHISSPNQIRMTSVKTIDAAVFWNAMPIKENEKLFEI